MFPRSDRDVSAAGGAFSKQKVVHDAFMDELWSNRIERVIRVQEDQ